MDKKQYVTYCGLYCDLCDQRLRLPQQASALLQTLRAAEYDEWAHSLPDFTEFWRFLNGLADVPEDKCCRNNTCGAPDCAMRACAIRRGVELCPECEDYPCDYIRRFNTCEPLLIHDGRRIQANGVDAWITKQEQRKAAGFCYSEVRCFPYDLPTEPQDAPNE